MCYPRIPLFILVIMIYSVKRFSGDDEKKGMGLGTKLALGTAAIGGTLLAGRAGMLGTKVQKGIGTATASLGKKLGSQRLLNDGANTVGNAAKSATAASYGIKNATQAKNVLGAQDFLTAKQDIQSAGKNASQGILDKFKIGG